MEKYFVFDLKPHDIDPNFIVWLKHQGISLVFNADGRRGAVVSRLDEPDKSISIDDLPTIEVDQGQMLPDSFEEQLMQGKETLAYKSHYPYHMGSDNYGRSRPLPPKCEHPNCLERWHKRLKMFEEVEKSQTTVRDNQVRCSWFKS